jgi:arylsulfatase A-like enzyme
MTILVALCRIPGIAENTIVLFFSDNGGAAYAYGGADNVPLRGGKGETFEGGVRVVSVIRWPGRVPAGARVESLLSVMDVFPTLAAAAGIERWEDPWEMNTVAVRRGQTQNEEYAHVPSMLADVRAGRFTEVDFITGALVREADRLGVPVPLNRALYRLVKARDRSFDEETTK